MTISCRTPEGDPNDCPVCGNRLRLEPSIDTRDAPCPSCGHLLWFSDQVQGVAPRQSMMISQNEMVPKEMAMKFAIKRFGLPTSETSAAMMATAAAKFEKIEWDGLFRAKSWEDVLVLVGAGKS